jgi:uncharacterized membrane protein YczE
MTTNVERRAFFLTGHSSAARWGRLFFGLLLFGTGIGLLLESNLGSGPWDVFHQGISRHTGIPVGLVSTAMAVPLLLAWLPLGERPGWATIANTVLVGLLIDTSMYLLPAQSWLPTQLLFVACGVLICGVGGGIYLSAGFGAGPRDGLMMGLHRRTGLSIRLVRTLMEVVVLAFGWLLGGTIGIGTVAFAFGIGPAIQATMRALGALPPRPSPSNASRNP